MAQAHQRHYEPGQRGADANDPETEEKAGNPHNTHDAGQMMAIWDYLRDARWSLELEAFMNENYYNGEHYQTYNFQDNRIEIVPFSKMGSNTTVNRVAEKTDQAVSKLTKDEFRFDVQPADGVDESQMSDEDRERIQNERDWADYQYRIQKIDRKIPEICLEGAKFGEGYWAVGYDAQADVVLANGKKIAGEIWIDWKKWWTIYTDPIAKSFDEQRFMADAEPMPMGEMRRQFPNAEAILHADERVSASEYEERLRKLESGGKLGAPTFEAGGDLATMLRIKLYYWKWVSVELDDHVNGGKRKAMQKKLYCCHITESGLILKQEEHPWGDFFPYEPFNWKAAAGKIHTQGLVRQIRLPNKALNRLVTSSLEYSEVFKGKILEPRSANVQVINDEHGERVLYDNAGGKPEYWQVPPINQTIPMMTDYLERKIDDLSMIHPESSGRAGFQGQSGVHAEVIASGDAENLATTRNNLKRSLGGIFKKALKVASIEYKKQDQITESKRELWSKTEKRRFAIGGQDINIDDDVHVQTQPSFASTKQYQIETTLKMYELGLISAQDALKPFQFTEMDEVMARREEEREGLSADEDASVAELENRALASGKNPPGPAWPFNVETHRDIHLSYLQSPEVQNNDTLKAKVMALLDWESQKSQEMGGLPDEMAAGAGAQPPQEGPPVPQGMPQGQPMPPGAQGGPQGPPMPPQQMGGVPPNAPPQ